MGRCCHVFSFGRQAKKAAPMNSLQWGALYCTFMAVYAAVMIGERSYRNWIDGLSEKAAAFEEMCETIHDKDME